MHGCMSTGKIHDARLISATRLLGTQEYTTGNHMNRGFYFISFLDLNDLNNLA